jgi:hypothetical protein
VGSRPCARQAVTVVAMTAPATDGTSADPAAAGWTIDDPVIRLRALGSKRVFDLARSRQPRIAGCSAPRPGARRSLSWHATQLGAGVAVIDNAMIELTDRRWWVLVGVLNQLSASGVAEGPPRATSSNSGRRSSLSPPVRRVPGEDLGDSRNNHDVLRGIAAPAAPSFLAAPQHFAPRGALYEIQGSWHELTNDRPLI